ncbi:MAG: Rpp14/Pop5 family protein [Methanoregula sp.]|nr:Rpp14/Pop5 family protein [Methanoregula sp.]
MSVRPPTLREKRRYILARIEPVGTLLEQKELYYAISEATTTLWGDATTAIITPAVVALEHGHVVIRCRRGTERELAIALSTVTACRDVRICLRIIAASGTIESLRSRFRPKKYPKTKVQPDIEAGSVPEPASAGAETGVEPVVSECTFAKKTYVIQHCNSQKIDVIEKGFKNTNRLFLTKDDLEDLNATTISDRI